MLHRPQLAGFMEQSTSSHLKHQYSRSSSKSATEQCLSITVELQVSLRARHLLWEDDDLSKRYKLYMPGTGHRVHTCRRGTRNWHVASSLYRRRRLHSTATPVTGTSLARPSTAPDGVQKGAWSESRYPDVLRIHVEDSNALGVRNLLRRSHSPHGVHESIRDGVRVA